MWPETLDSITLVHKPFAAESLQLARDCNVPSVIKHCMYELLRHPQFRLSDPRELDDDEEEAEDGKSDGNVSEDAPNEDGDEEEDQKSSSVDVESNIEEADDMCHGSVISEADLHLLIFARAYLSDVWSSAVFHIPKLECDRFQNADPKHADWALLHWQKTIHESGFSRNAKYDPLLGFAILADIPLAVPEEGKAKLDISPLWSKEGDKSWCSKCLSSIKEEFADRREKLWKDLDKYLGLN